MSTPLIQRHRWRPALFGCAIAWGVWVLLQLANPNPITFILVIVLFVLTAWLIGRLRTSR
jgi:hypothetical protein